MEKKLPKPAHHRERLSRLLSKAYRDSFIDADVKGGIAYQIQALREKLGLSQTAFAKKLGGKKQAFVSRLEDTEDGNLNINTLLEIAKALDIGLQVKFCDYLDVLERDISPSGLRVDSIFETFEKIQKCEIESSHSNQTIASPVFVNKNSGEKLWRINLPQVPITPYSGSATPNSGNFMLTKRS